MVERAKGALMLRLGVGSPEALGLLLAWVHETRTDLDALCQVLVRGVVHRDGAVVAQEGLLVRWLEVRLRSLERR